MYLQRKLNLQSSLIVKTKSGKPDGPKDAVDVVVENVVVEVVDAADVVALDELVAEDEVYVDAVVEVVVRETSFVE
jgi:hypothetical protein